MILLRSKKFFKELEEKPNYFISLEFDFNSVFKVITDTMLTGCLMLKVMLLFFFYDFLFS